MSGKVTPHFRASLHEFTAMSLYSSDVTESVSFNGTEETSWVETDRAHGRKKGGE